ncbi:MAG: DUF1778 domain-containing protein [bacterium]|nr:DUF1778 domain-containing protein [bacterium]
MAKKGSKYDEIRTPINSAQYRTKKVIQQAAQLNGESMSEFVIRHVLKSAQRSVQRQSLIQLSKSGQEKLVRALLSKSSPNQTLIQAANEYKKLMEM